MNDFIPPPISYLECLPDELFYDIFEYLSVRDLYDGFYNLNCRFVSILASLTNLYDNQQWTRVLSLHTLNISIGDPRVYSQILHSCPSLIRLRLEFKRYFTRPPKEFCDPSHISLRRFNLRLNCTTFSCNQIIDLLLSLVPNLTHFSITGPLSDVNDININSLADILHQRVPKLEQFYFEMAVQESLANTLQDNNWQKTRQLHPLFINLKLNPSTQHIPARLIIQSKSK